MVKNLMSPRFDHRKWLLPLLSIACLGWAWNRVHWDAATVLTASKDEPLRWNFHSQPCQEMMGYFVTYGFNSRPTADLEFTEFKENASMLHSCWPSIQNQSRALQINVAGGLIPKEYTDTNRDPIDLVQSFFPKEVFPAHGAAADSSPLYARLADRLINGDNTEQIRALGYSCQSPQHAAAIKSAISAQPEPYSRGWYAIEMLEHCQLNPTERQAYLRRQWKAHPKAHSFLMLEWGRYHGALPDDFQASEDPLEQAIFQFLAAKS